MNMLVVYFTKFGNTHTIADAIAGVFESAGSVRSLSLDELAASDLGELDLVVLGSPTHRMNLPEAVKMKFESLPKRVLKGSPGVVFDTSYKMSWFLSQFTAAKKLGRVLRKMGGIRIKPPETFRVEGREGPLYPGEIERAQDWARMILKSLGS